MDVFADFLKYLFGCARDYICENYGDRLWTSVKDSIEFVLSHPNGWGGVQQKKTRKAAAIAGLVPNTLAGHRHIQLLTEGEASMNYCLKNGFATNALQGGAVSSNLFAYLISITATG